MRKYLFLFLGIIAFSAFTASTPRTTLKMNDGSTLIGDVVIHNLVSETINIVAVFVNIQTGARVNVFTRGGSSTALSSYFNWRYRELAFRRIGYTNTYAMDWRLEGIHIGNFNHDLLQTQLVYRMNFYTTIITQSNTDMSIVDFMENSIYDHQQRRIGWFDDGVTNSNIEIIIDHPMAGLHGVGTYNSYPPRHPLLNTIQRVENSPESRVAIYNPPSFNGLPITNQAGINYATMAIRITIQPWQRDIQQPRRPVGYLNCFFHWVESLSFSGC